MTQYLMSVWLTEDDEVPSDDEIAQIYADVDAFNEKIKAQGAWVFGGGLHPADTATVVRPADGEALITDGPFAEAKEQIGGFWIIESENLDAALAMASEAAIACRGPVEVRPFQDEPEA